MYPPVTSAAGYIHPYIYGSSPKFYLMSNSFNPIGHGGGRILPMARKFRNSSNSEEFGELALLDFSPFVTTKP